MSLLLNWFSTQHIYISELLTILLVSLSLDVDLLLFHWIEILKELVVTFIYAWFDASSLGISYSTLLLCLDSMSTFLRQSRTPCRIITIRLSSASRWGSQSTGEMGSTVIDSRIASDNFFGPLWYLLKRKKERKKIVIYFMKIISSFHCC